jgi:hypothetical protein
LFAAHSLEAEELGNFRLSSYLIETQFVGGDDSRMASGFHLGKSYFSLAWDKSEQVGGFIRISSSDLTENPKWYNATYEHKSNFSEAFAFFKRGEGSYQMGLQQVPFGLESYLGLNLRALDDSFLLQKRYVSYSDLGLAYESQSGGFKTNMLIHNGQGLVRDSVKQNDDKFFYTARFSKEREDNSLIGFSAQFGQFTEEGQTNNHKLSMYNLFGIARFGKTYLSLDLVTGKDKTDTTEKSFYVHAIDIRYPITSSLSVLARYNIEEPDADTDDDQNTGSLIGFVWNDAGANSRLGIYLSENKEESGQKDRLFLLNWKLSSTNNKRY